MDGYTCGAPIAAIIRNTNTRSGDYSNLKDCPRPGHADYTAQAKYGGYQDASGGGHFSGRLTAPLCIAGGLCKQWLEAEGIRIRAIITRIGSVSVGGFILEDPEHDHVHETFPVLDEEHEMMFREEIARAKADGDSVGGIIQCAVNGLPIGIGEPMFGGMESRIAQIIYGIPAVKGLEFGYGFYSAQLRGSENNDRFYYWDDKEIRTVSNGSGGILGGITNGMPLTFNVAIKPTPSIAKPQQTVNLKTGENTTIEIKGRHDPCIVPRAVPVVEAAAAIAIYDAYLEWKARK